MVGNRRSRLNCTERELKLTLIGCISGLELAFPACLAEIEKNLSLHRTKSPERVRNPHPWRCPQLPGIVLTLVAWNNYTSSSASCPGLGIDLGHWENEGPGLLQLNLNSISLLWDTAGSGASIDRHIAICSEVLFDMRNYVVAQANILFSSF